MAASDTDFSIRWQVTTFEKQNDPGNVYDFTVRLIFRSTWLHPAIGWTREGTPIWIRRLRLCIVTTDIPGLLHHCYSRSLVHLLRQGIRRGVDHRRTRCPWKYVSLLLLARYLHGVLTHRQRLHAFRRQRPQRRERRYEAGIRHCLWRFNHLGMSLAESDLGLKSRRMPGQWPLCRRLAVKGLQIGMLVHSWLRRYGLDNISCVPIYSIRRVYAVLTCRCVRATFFSVSSLRAQDPPAGLVCPYHHNESLS